MAAACLDTVFYSGLKLAEQRQRRFSLDDSCGLNLAWPQRLSLSPSLRHSANSFLYKCLPRAISISLALSVMSEYNLTILLNYSQNMTHSLSHAHTQIHTYTLDCNNHNCIQRSRKHRVKTRLRIPTCMNEGSFPSGSVPRWLQNRPNHFLLTMRLEAINKTNLMKRDRKFTKVIFHLRELQED